MKRCFALYVVFVFLFTALTGNLFAATENFPISSIVGGDSTPPSIPGSVVATGVATTQINVTWASSTDNFSLAGYHVWRDDVQIATTTVAQYVDTGLSASTTYFYYITAFDSFFNFSASSSIATGTTLAPTPSSTPTTTENTEEEGGFMTGSKLPPFPEMLNTLTITPSKDTVVIRYTTDRYIRGVVRWGRSTDYELGTIQEDIFSTSHETTISGLDVGTTYYISIEGETGQGRSGVFLDTSFKTMPPDDIYAPGNVSDLTVRLDDNEVILNWVNPEDSDFSYVRVLENELFYPVDTADGKVIYEDDGTEARSTWGESDRVRYFTVFTYDEIGNVSSGAIIRVSKEGEVIVVDEQVPVDPMLNPISLTLDDFMFFQEGEQIYQKDGSLEIDGSKQLTISIAYEKLPEHLKTIMVTVTDSRSVSREFSFLLRINSDKTAYTSTLAPFGYGGTFPLTITVFDYDTQQIGYTQGVLSARIAPLHTEDSTFNFWAELLVRIMQSYVTWSFLLLVLFVLIGRRLVHAY